MAAKKLFRVRKEHIKEIECISNYYCEKAFSEGFVFLREKGKSSIYMMNSRVNRKTLDIVLIEDMEVVEG